VVDDARLPFPSTDETDTELDIVAFWFTAQADLRETFGTAIRTSLD